MTSARPARPASLRSRIARSELVRRVLTPQVSITDDALRQAVSGTVVLITGASFGIGESTARRVAAAGATTLLVARTAEVLEEVAEKITADGGIAHAYPADLTDADQVDDLVQRVLAEHGHVDFLVSNAGRSIRRLLSKSYDRFHDFQRTIDINYLGPVRLVLGLLPSMRERKSGHLVNISTWAALLPPSAGWSAYVASKSAFDVFFRTVGVESSQDNVTTSTIYMTLVHTRMSAPTEALRHAPGLTPDEAAELVIKAIVERSQSITSWYTWAGNVGFTAVRAPLEKFLSWRRGR
ncbi:SDR family NAD(P)-dependent oxidoreductase [Pseudonocardiaceae bacterium YIM PH 21723]|nr:SDR family NAD(P)-dependent oxidoreductase [Pseudonocardiaceae bacterium YIM PH 21723]